MDLLKWNRGCAGNSRKQIDLLKKQIQEMKEKVDGGSRAQLIKMKKQLAEAYKR